MYCDCHADVKFEGKLYTDRPAHMGHKYAALITQFPFGPPIYAGHFFLSFFLFEILISKQFVM